MLYNNNNLSVFGFESKQEKIPPEYFTGCILFGQGEEAANMIYKTF